MTTDVVHGLRRVSVIQTQITCSTIARNPVITAPGMLQVNMLYDHTFSV